MEHREDGAAPRERSGDDIAPRERFAGGLAFLDRPYEGLAPRQYGRALAVIAIALSALGVLMIYSASTFWGEAKFDDPEHFLKRQLLGVVLGLLALLGCSRLGFRAWDRGRWLAFGFSAILLVLVLIVGSRYNGARRWLRFGGIGFQPSEFAKLAAVVWAAAFASRAGDRLTDFRRGFLPGILPILVLSGLTLIEPDLGTAFVIGLLGVLVLRLAGIRIYHLFVSAGIGLPVVLFFMMSRFEYIGARLRFFFAGDQECYQVKQASLALGSGGLIGRGIGAGTGKLFFLPEVAGDFIFPSIGEEIGYLGVCLVVLLFVAMVWCGYRVARGILPVSRFGFLLAMGLTTWIALQAATNLLVVSGSVPTKGIALPFISYGSSSLVMSLAAVGILVSLSRDRRANLPWEDS